MQGVTPTVEPVGVVQPQEMPEIISTEDVASVLEPVENPEPVIQPPTVLKNEPVQGVTLEDTVAIGVTPTEQQALNSEDVKQGPRHQPGGVSSKKIKENNKKKENNVIIALIIVTLLLIIIAVIMYIFVLEPKNRKKEQDSNQQNNNTNNENNQNKPANVSKNSFLCTIELNNTSVGRKEQATVIFVYNKQNRQILSSERTGLVQLDDEKNYTRLKKELQRQQENGQNSEGVQVSYVFDDENLLYHLTENRDYEKATEKEKDESWTTTVEEANDYYVGLGYICDPINNPNQSQTPTQKPDETQKPNENQELQETKVELTSMTGNSEVDYNNWNVKLEEASLSQDKNTMTVKLQVENKATTARTLNGKLKLYNDTKQNIRNTMIKQQVDAKKTVTILLEVPKKNTESNSSLGNLDDVDLELITTYLIELYS